MSRHGTNTNPESQHTFGLIAFQNTSMLGSLSTQLANEQTLKTKPFSRFFSGAVATMLILINQL